jgi:hypothetical protein
VDPSPSLSYRGRGSNPLLPKTGVAPREQVVEVAPDLAGDIRAASDCDAVESKDLGADVAHEGDLGRTESVLPLGQQVQPARDPLLEDGLVKFTCVLRTWLVSVKSASCPAARLVQDAPPPSSCLDRRNHKGTCLAEQV